MAKRFQDKYYTPNNVVKAVLKVVEKEIMPLNKFSRIIEPSAGAGAFLKQLPNTAIGYDIAPEFDGIIQGDYLKQDIPYMKNSIVIGNPPFGRSGMLAKEFIKKSIEHSDYVAFVISGDNYNRKSSIKGVKLFKSYMLPEVEYSGVKLKCCFNIYCRGKEKVKMVKNIEIEEWHKNPRNTGDIERWKQKECDYRLICFGTIRLISKSEKVYCGEIKITFKDKRNFGPVLEKAIAIKSKTNVSSGAIHKQDIIDLIYDTYPDLRAN